MYNQNEEGIDREITELISEIDLNKDSYVQSSSITTNKLLIVIIRLLKSIKNKV